MTNKRPMSRKSLTSDLERVRHVAKRYVRVIAQGTVAEAYTASNLHKAYGGQISLLKGIDASPVETGNENANEPV